MVPSFKISRFRTQNIFQLKELFRVSIWFRRRFTVWLSPDEVMLISALRPETDEAHILSLESAIAPEVAQAADVDPVLPTAAAVGVLSLPFNILLSSEESCCTNPPVRFPSFILLHAL